MTKPLASLSLDLDNKWSYLKTHGDRGWEAFPSYLDRVVPCFLELLEQRGLRITVFVVGQDAALSENQGPLASIAAAGHEVGNHSFHHEPWLHLYSPEEIEREIGEAEEAIRATTGQRPVGFRGPGYSSSPAVLACLASRGYEYDASSLPTIVGPLARAYYFLTARLTAEQRRQRKRLFGGMADGLKPLAPYWWQFQGCDANTSLPPLLEIPVTTLPLFRVPIHFSYLLYLAEKSSSAAFAYWRGALAMCRAARIEPSLLLHPLDFLGADDEPSLGFFPAMGMPGQRKRALVGQFLEIFQRWFAVVPMGEHASAIAERRPTRVRHVDCTAVFAAGRRIAVPALAEPALVTEADR